MRKLRPPALVFMLACLSVFPAARAGANSGFTGAYLLHVCESDGAGKEKVPGGHIACQAYITGVLDYHRMLQSLKLAPKIDICVPEQASMNELHKIVLDYLHKRSEHDTFVAAPAVTMALYEKYPCRR